MSQEILDLTTGEFVKAHIERSFQYVRGSRECPAMSDPEMIWLNVQRVLRKNQSGRDFLQCLDEIHGRPLPRATYFDALQSKRRADTIKQVAAAIERLLVDDLARGEFDLLGEFPELADCAVYAFDGNVLQHGCHDDLTDKGGHVGTNTIYGLDLHTGLCRHFAPAASNGKKHHEWPVFKQYYPEFYEAVAKQAKQVYIIADMAYTDNPFWCALSRKGQAKFICRMKENIKPTFSEPILFDADLPINTGVKTQCCVGLSNAGTMRMIEYEDPESGKSFTFITSDMDLQPGLIAWLYKLRWRIEKLFDTLENKLDEPKAWATGRVAQTIQTASMAITHNLLFYLRYVLGRDAGIREEKVEKKRRRALEAREEKAAKEGRTLHPFSKNLPIIQLTVQFIRTFRNHLRAPIPLTGLLGRFRTAMVAYT